MSGSYSNPFRSRELRRSRGFATPISMGLRGYSYARVRNVLQIPWDNVVDSGSALECFFQMPINTNAIRRAQVWVQLKPYRIPSSTASTVTGGSITSASGAASLGAPNSTVAIVGIAGTGASTHAHTDPQGGVTGTDASPGFINSISTTNDTVGTGTHAHADGGHTHSVNIGSHTHALNTTISEVAASGTVSLFVADDGSTYGSAIVSGASAIASQSITSQLTATSGDKRIKITATGSARVQVLLLLDLVLVPLGPGQ